MKNLILVIGRTGSGKDTLVRYAQPIFNAASIPSYTDRPMRPAETDGVEHTFLTGEEFDKVMHDEQVLAYTKIGETGYRYCTTVEQIARIPADTIFYTIDPAGYQYCKKYATNCRLSVIYVKTSDELRRERANKRNGDNTTFEKRCLDENDQFDEFEREQAWDACIENDGDVQTAQQRMVDAVKSILNGPGTTKNTDGTTEKFVDSLRRIQAEQRETICFESVTQTLRKIKDAVKAFVDNPLNCYASEVTFWIDDTKTVGVYELCIKGPGMTEFIQENGRQIAMLSIPELNALRTALYDEGFSVFGSFGSDGHLTVRW